MDKSTENLTPRQRQHLQHLADARERLETVLEGLEQEVICSQPVLGDWTIKDILGHIVTWNREFRENIAMILQGQHPGYDHVISGKDNFKDWNQVHIAQNASLPLDQVLDDIEKDTQEARDLIRKLSPEDYRQRGVTPWKESALHRPDELSKEDTDSVETLVTFHWRHMNMHIRDIEKWRWQLG